LIIFARIFAIPLAFVATVVMLAFKRDIRGIAAAAAFFLATLAAGWWAITRSHASTAGIGFLFLPLSASIAVFLGLGFGRGRVSGNTTSRVLAWLGVVAASAIVVSNLVSGMQTIAKNRRRDDEQQRFSAEVWRERTTIADALKAHPGHERVWLDSAVRANIHDRAFLLAALPSDSISPELLDTLASSPDLGVTLEAVRNPNARAETLTRVYRTASYPDYFFQALAAHRNTPPEILRQLYKRPRTITGLEIWFAGNPSTPKEILRDIARKTSDRSVAAALLENPALDCTTLSQLSVNLMKDHNRDADDPAVARLNERLPEVCKNTTRD